MGPAAGSVQAAFAAIMDTPHPLDILGEPGSYGNDVGTPLCVPPTSTCLCFYTLRSETH